MATDREQIKEFLDIASEQMKIWMNSIDVEALSAAKKLILDAEANKNRVHVTGIGKPGHVAGYAASLLSSTATPAYELHGTEAVRKLRTGSSGRCSYCNLQQW